ncbi:hypothetical protein BJF93_03630 [Xaviernesmea oryzae]|uniref:Uncharacterized protein n=1 Tax=Xaviernesmea oryzae TaxID=464029 RepID=A0A1Q9AUD5_9HYPH|nr:hypothetical protein [Xaviernesmea oryzae]OLP59028.1 hypothetical protein BJF93_03630 [Xaviernesmea oryzae]SEK89938.1 hypothetical protein SAMN04487976_104319 [Xaviernesmea oryzae]
MRFLMRVMSFLALVLAVVLATVDALQSVAAAAPVFMPLSEALAGFGNTGLSLVQALERPHPDMAFVDPMLRMALMQPATVIFLGLSLLFWMAGYVRPRPRTSLA